LYRNSATACGFTKSLCAELVRVWSVINQRGILNVINFHRIGKRSPAHDLAIKVFKGKVPPDREISAKEVLKEFRK
jgi:hypothetical protein